MEYLQVGKVSNVHGLGGDLKVIPLTDDIKRFGELEGVYIGMDKDYFEIEKVSYQKGQAIIKFKGIDSLSEAEEKINTFLWVKVEEAKRPEGAYFLFEIIGLDVYTVDGDFIGKVRDVLQPGANDVYVVKDGEKEHLIPGIKEVIKEIDLDEKKMTIDPIEGMIE
jgi:16S rRNA processing protein RimM